MSGKTTEGARRATFSLLLLAGVLFAQPLLADWNVQVLEQGRWCSTASSGRETGPRGTLCG